MTAVDVEARATAQEALTMIEMHLKEYGRNYLSHQAALKIIHDGMEELDRKFGQALDAVEQQIQQQADIQNGAWVKFYRAGVMILLAVVGFFMAQTYIGIQTISVRTKTMQERVIDGGNYVHHRSP
jgi:uncharacterized protein YbgA (DUF1722 family)